MNPISHPLKAKMSGPAVADLHVGLLFLLPRGIPPLGEGTRLELENMLRIEQDKNLYDKATLKTVALYQEYRQLQVTEEVDEATARALNEDLRRLGAFDQEPPAPSALEPRLVGGAVRFEDGSPLQGGLIRAFHADERGMLRLGEDATDAEGRYTIRYTALPGMSSVDLRLVVLSPDGNPLYESDVFRDAKPLEVVDLRIPPAPGTVYRVEGTVGRRGSAGVGGLRVIVVDKAVGGDVRLAQTTTDDRGAYRVSFPDTDIRRRNKDRPDLQVCVIAGQTLLASSEVRYNAASRETINIVLDESAVPSAALQSEHAALTAALSRHVPTKLRELQETDERQDITYLANKTGWDARAVALAALADRFAAASSAVGGDGSAGIEPAYFYALLRAGLPADEMALYRTDPAVVESVWKQAAAQGIIPAHLENGVPEAVVRFRQEAALRVLDGPALVGVSPLSELVAASLGDDGERQRKFADLYVRHRSDPAKLWPAVRETFGEAAERRLKLDGQLAYMTLNNAPLIRRLHAAHGTNGLDEARRLVSGGYYRAEKWRELIGDDPIPPEISGENDAEKRQRYAELLAAHVRLGFPTDVVADTVKKGVTPLKSPELSGQVHAFLTDHRGRFEIGVQPIEQFVAQSGVQVAPEVTAEIARIQRVYQLTPGDEAMNALLAKGADSAYAVTRYAPDEFVAAFRDEVGEEQARNIYARAQQVHNTVLNVALTYMAERNAPGIGALSSARIIDSADPSAEGAGDTDGHTASDIIAYPTLENLFGGMDYCSCEHCRSVLSPAAYLVDLLLFIDRPAPPPGTDNPLTVLLERRPDIQHLPLTCENTNTPLPYIDLVNETLEYYVVNRMSLDGYAGHSTDGGQTPEELMANPQFVSDSAYELLAGRPARPGDPAPLLPPVSPLPFHRPLEAVRRYFDKLEAPLSAVMEALRADDRIERAGADDYGWRDILMEELRFSRVEYALLIDRALTLSQLYGFPPDTPESDVVAELSNAKSFARRMDVTYEELAAVLKTRFVNPSSALLPKLERLGVSFVALKAYKSGELTDAQFEELLAPHLDPSAYGGDIRTWVLDDANYAAIMGLIVLSRSADDEGACDFGKRELRYAEPDPAANRLRAFEFVRLYRFIRLWKKLGWTIEQTDQAIAALYPADQLPDTGDDAVNLQRLDDGFRTMLPRLGIVKRILSSLELKPDADLPSLLACFAPIGVYGERSLYRQLFLSPALLKPVEAFADDGYGRFPDDTQKLLAHADTLRGACRLTADELAWVAAALGFDDATPLTLDAVSAVYRRGWLARKLKWSVRELLAMIRFTGIDPFAAPDPADAPIMRLIGLASRLREASLTPAETLLLLWNEDVYGRPETDTGEALALARAERAEFAAIDRDFAFAGEPDDEQLRARIALIYGAEAADRFVGLLRGRVATDVAYAHGEPALPQAWIDAAQGNIAYDHLRKRLSYTAGVMPDTVRDALAGADAATDSFRDAVAELYRKTRSWFDRYPELKPHYDAYAASDKPEGEKRAALLAALLPGLIRRRKRQTALAAVAAAARTEPAFAEATIGAAAVLHAAADAARPALDDIVAAETPGLAARFYFRSTATGPVDLASDAEADLAYSPDGGNRLPVPPTPSEPISGIWSGYLEAPDTGFYNFCVETDADAAVEMTLGGASILTKNGDVWSNAAAIELRAGTLYPVSLRVENVKEKLRVRWETSGRGLETIPPGALYPSAAVDRLRGAYVRLRKSVALAAALKLTPAEFARFSADPAYRIGGSGWPNALPVASTPDAATSAALFRAFGALLDFARLKGELSPQDERLLAVLADPAGAAQSPAGLLYRLTGWEPEALAALLARFGRTAGDLADIGVFRRVHEAYALAKRTGIAVFALLRAATNEPDAAAARDLQAAMRSRFGESEWLSALKPVHDELRSLSRDALVAYVLHGLRSRPDTAHIDTPDKLFEYFLMDVQMEPCMETSRIRFAIASVQLFVERCLMNLERRVSPSALRVKQWEWMNRYRVWEANRKVFLYPENWLEPELRDDQSPFFKEAMSELLQSDITEDAAAKVLLNYLTKLDEVAKLETCGIYCEESESGRAEESVVHVIARTPGGNRKYFYRRREYGYWTPWEQVRLDIEDTPVLPVVWNGRLFLFWLKLLKEAPLAKPQLPNEDLSTVDASALVGSNAAKLTVKAILCWSEYLGGKWQPPRTSDVRRPAALSQFEASGDNAFDRSELQLSASWRGKALNIHISGQGSATFILYNTHSLPVLDDGSPSDPYIWTLPPQSRHLDTDGDRLTITYNPGGFIVLPGSSLERPVLGNPIADRAVGPRHPVANPWDAPFVYEDARHAFYVTTEERIVTVPEWSGFAPVPGPFKPLPYIPQLVLPELPVEVRPIPEPNPFGPIAGEPDFGAVAAPAVIARFVSEDAYISRGIATAGTIRFDDRLIGPAGGINPALRNG
jgi:hypothetical protein